MITQHGIGSEAVQFHQKDLSRRRRKVLVVDDNDDVRQLVAKALELIGCDVIEAQHGLAAYERFCLHGADLVVSDIEMPVLDGYGLVEMLNRISPQTPIVMITGHSSHALEEDPVLSCASVRAVLYKPFPLKKLQQVAQAAMECGVSHGMTA